MTSSGHPFEISEILTAYFSCLPAAQREAFSAGGDIDPRGISDMWERALVGSDRADIERSFAYYDALRETCRDRMYALSYNEPASLIWPFVIDRVISLFADPIRKELFSALGAADPNEAARVMEGSIDARNAFRRAFLAGVNGPILSFLYSMVYLMGFSSGGESSFLERVFTRVRHWEGHLLDAGGGSGFAGLLLSTRGPVTYIDFSPFRAGRARAVAALARREPAFFARMLDLIDRESSVFGLSLDRSLIPSLGSGELTCRSGDISTLPEDLGPFDGAILTDVLEHTTDPEGTLRSIGGILRPGAPLLLTVPTDAGGIVGKIREEEEGYAFPFLLHIEFFSDDRIERMAKTACLSVVELVHFSYEKATCLGQAPMEVMAILRKD